uniref:Snurportin-1 n=1 Tax=Arcella intermedia TaxID=1963864 RepID=A0A6B2LK88_9EUKA
MIQKYKDNLMLFEEMRDVPEDLETHWICVPVPVGKRCLLISAQQNTMSRLKNGTLIENFKSLLPGGGGRKKDPIKDYCLLDCILSDQTLSYYVLDLMVWKGQMYYDCESEFRFFWAQSKLSEEEGLDEISDRNQLKIVPLPRFGCDKKGLQEALKRVYPFMLAGFLLYHKEAYYTFDSTPLACSASVQMLQKILEK